jgi:P4 family phage/plasmid primase-like protien
MHIMAQPFLRDVLPPLTKCSKLASYQVSGNRLSFWLDLKDHYESSVEHCFSFRTGHITSAKGEGIIHEMYSMKRFFQDGGNINLIADVLAEQGIGERMMFDRDEMQWMIYNETLGIWQPASTRCTPEVIVSRYIEDALRPVKLAEDFFNKEILWVDSGASLEEGAEDSRGTDLSMVPSDSVSQVGGKRAYSITGEGFRPKFKRSKVASALFMYAQNVKCQAEILKVLETRLIISFDEKRKADVLCCPNGLVDLRAAKLMRMPRADDYVFQVCKIPYDPQADLEPAISFYQRYFPLEAYPDQMEIIDFIQKLSGYSITLETSAQLCLVCFGDGSNGKSILIKPLHAILGEEQCMVIPLESLGKARGQNNDSLHNARFARAVTLEESPGKGTRLNKAVFKNLVGGDIITNKRMYKAEINFRPKMKLIFVLNELPADFLSTDESDKASSFSMDRRVAYLHMETIFVDETKEIEKIQADNLREMGRPECMIQVKDPHYYERCVEPFLPSFFRFYVEGAKKYYANPKIEIPQRMQASPILGIIADPKVKLREFVRARLVPTAEAEGKRLTVAEIESKFKEYAEGCINVKRLTRATFGKDLATVINEIKAKSPMLWDNVRSDQRVVEKQKIMVYFNLYWRPAELSIEERYASPSRQ